MSKINIIRVPILPFGLVNAFLIETEQGLIAVDTGLPGTEHKFKRILKSNNWNFSDIKLIVITHAHVDHAGNAKSLQRLTQAPIIAHKADLIYLEGLRPMEFCPTGWFGKLFLKTGLMHQAYERFTPDILINDQEEYSLNRLGINGKIIHTAGHTKGSLSVLIDNHHALVGDMISSGILLGGLLLKNSPKPPPFEENPQQVKNELNMLLNAGVEHFYMGHGGPLCACHVKHYLSRINR